MKLMKCTAGQIKDTGLAVTLILLIILLFTKNNKLIVPAIVTHVITMTWPKFYTPVAPLWFGLSHLLGSIVSRVLLTLVFVVIVSPVGVIRRLMGIDSMGIKKWKDGNNSVFVERNHTYTRPDLEIPY